MHPGENAFQLASNLLTLPLQPLEIEVFLPWNSGLEAAPASGLIHTGGADDNKGFALH